MKPPLVCLGLSAAMVGVFAATPELDPAGLARMGAMVPRLVVEEGQVWRVLTAGFVHVGLAHLSVNVLALLALGVVLEPRLSRTTTLVLVFVAMLGSALSSLALSAADVSAGASGAVFGLVGGALVTGWRARGWGALQLGGLAGAAVALILVDAMGRAHVDAWNHLGGLFSGMAFAVVLQRPVGAMPRLAGVAAGLMVLSGLAAATAPERPLDPEGDALMRYFNVDTAPYQKGYVDLHRRIDVAVRAKDRSASRALRNEASRLRATLPPVGPSMHVLLLSHASQLERGLLLLDDGRGAGLAPARDALSQSHRAYIRWRSAVGADARLRGYRLTGK